MATAEDEQSGSPAGNATTPAASSTPSTDPEGTEVPEPTEEPEPAQEPDATVTAVDLSDYEEIDERALAQIVKAPDDHIARQVVLYGRITQLDAATGKCFVRISVSHAAQTTGTTTSTTPSASPGTASRTALLDPFVADDEVKLWVTIGGSLSDDTQIGGSATVPAYLIHEMELL